MKKIFTMILFAAGTISFASAQSYGKDNAYNDNKKMSNDRDEHFAFDKDKSAGYNNSYFSLREKQARLERIDREFDQKIAAVRYNRRLSGREKSKQIKFLQMQKQDEIRKVEFEFAKSNRNNKSHGHDSRW
jgi:hypothetical protein